MKQEQKEEKSSTAIIMDEPTNAQIMEKLISIEQRLECVTNPMKSVTFDQRAKVFAEAVKSGDKARIKAARKVLNA